MTLASNTNRKSGVIQQRLQTPWRQSSRGGVLADFIHDGLKRFSWQGRNGQVAQAKVEQQLDLALLFRRDLRKGPGRFFVNLNGERSGGHVTGPFSASFMLQLPKPSTIVDRQQGGRVAEFGGRWLGGALLTGGSEHGVCLL